MALTPITGRKECTDAFRALASFLKTGATKLPKVVGWPHGHEELTIYWRRKEKFWVSFGIGESSAYWFPFGTMDPYGHPTVNITCQISVPTEGINRRCGGLFLRGSGT